jgi:hypothetical protein
MWTQGLLVTFSQLLNKNQILQDVNLPYSYPSPNLSNTHSVINNSLPSEFMGLDFPKVENCLIETA